MNDVTSSSPEVISMSCQSVIPIPQIIGVREIRKDVKEAVFLLNIEYVNWVVEKTRSNPPMRVSRPIAFPKSEKILKYKAHDAVPEFVNSPVFAIATAPKESPE